MKSELLYYINKYKDLIINESYDFIIDEMVSDLKETLLDISDDIETNYQIIETFYNINNSGNVIDELANLESLLMEGGLSIPNIKVSFKNKHDKLIERDKKWLAKNKNKILGLNYEEIELEVLSDYKVTFEQLLNRHNIFDKVFTNSDDNSNLGEKLRRFEDKHNDLKNGLDNYFRTGTSRREIGLRKVRGEEAKFAVEQMIMFCESFLSGRQFLEEKMNAIIVSISDASVKESLTPIETLKVLLEDNAVKDILNTAKELGSVSKNKKSKEEEVPEEEPESVDVTSDEKEEKPVKKEKPESVDVTSDEKKEPESVDVTSDEEVPEEEPEAEEELDDGVEDEETPEEEPVEDQGPQRGIEDRQIGVAVLLSIAEERYFDYIEILYGLME